MDEIVNEFLVESRENLDRLDQELVALEQNADPNTLAAIFRTIHTIKGTSGFLGFSQLESITHAGENLLSKLRDGDLAVSGPITTGLLSMVDAVRGILEEIEDGGEEHPGDYSALVAVLERLQVPGAAGEPEPAPAPEPVAVVDDVVVEAEVEVEVETEIEVVEAVEEIEVEAVEEIEVEAAVPEPAPAPVVPAAPVPSAFPQIAAAEVGRIGEVLLRAGKITEVQLATAVSEQAAGDPRHVGELLVAMGAVTSDDVVEVLRTQQQERPTQAAAAGADTTIRVDVGLLDTLMNLVGELVLARNQILQHTESQSDAGFTATSQRLNLITTELQESVMKTRMQPIENLWNKFPRIVRDLAVTCGRQARLVMEGKDTELDKTILEAIKDPLTHLVRNAIDHGLEPPELRVSRGKPAEGTVRLRAFHEGGQVNIEIADDGAGINPEVIRQTAIQRGLITQDEAAKIPSRDLINFIFRAGFSTSAKVSNISGRGVGMDVVRTNIEAIGGTIDVQSTIGRGSTFKIKIPLTLAIIPALIVTCRGDRYAIPQVSLLELVRLDGPTATTAIETIHDVPVYRLRGQLLPLVFLRSVFGAEPHDDESINIVVLKADDQQFGLVVDEINDTAEIVVKPLGKLLKQTPIFAGATIMGDGHVALILDVLGMAEHTQILGGVRDSSRHDTDLGDGLDEDQRSTLLLFGLGDRRLALEMTMVARLEEFAAEVIETAGDRHVVQYRDEILPLVFLSRELGISSTVPAGALRVVVYADRGRSVGLVVDEIFDIVEEVLEVSTHTSARGVLGAAVVQGKVTDVLDVESVIRSSLPSLFADAAA